MAENAGNASAAVPENENSSGEDHVEEEKAQANREGKGAAAGQEFVRCYMEGPVPANAETREYEKRKREQKKKREEERRANPDILFISERSGEEDKLQFYSRDRNKWLELMKELAPKETVISIKLETNKGTIMSYSSREFVISGTETARNNFKEWFQEISLRNLTEGMTTMKIRDQHHQAEL